MSRRRRRRQGPAPGGGFLRVQLAPLLCSAAAEGLPRVWFPARDGTDSRSPGGKGEGGGGAGVESTLGTGVLEGAEAG